MTDEVLKALAATPLVVVLVWVLNKVFLRDEAREKARSDDLRDVIVANAHSNLEQAKALNSLALAVARIEVVINASPVFHRQSGEKSQ